MNGGRVADLYRANRSLVWLSVVIFVNQLGFGSVVPAVPLFANSFGVSQAAIGLTIAVYGLARFIFNVPTGQLADRIGRRRTLVLGEILTALGNLLCGLATSYEQFLFFRFIAGAGASIVVTGGQITLADLTTPANRGRTMAYYQAVFLFAVGSGPLPGGWLAERFGLNIPFFVFAALGILAAVVAWDKIPETLGMKEQRGPGRAGSLSHGQSTLGGQLRSLFSQVGFSLVSLVTFVQFFARTGAVFGVIPIMATARLGLSADQIGAGISMVSLGNLLMVYLSGMLVDRFGRKPVIVPSALLTGVAFALVAVAPSYPWFMLSLALCGLSAGIGGPAPAAYAVDMAPPGMNAITMASYRTIADFGYVVGPLLLGWVADLLSGQAAILITAAMFLVSGTLFALFAPETRGRKVAGT